MSPPVERHLGLFAATSIGVGAIVGGGILALAGVAFAATGPGAILAFALNGGIAFLTARTFAELAVRFPQSGGTYTYAKRVLSIEVAFVVGWVVWFASILAGVLYALGFSAFLTEGLGRILSVGGRAPDWLGGDGPRLGIALGAATVYGAALVRSASGGGNAATIGKMLVFAVLIGGGALAWIFGPASELMARLDPFLPAGPTGLVQAMGYTFIALQGFDLIAAVGGEVKDPARNLPRAMYLSLAIALLIYLPLLFLIATVGAPEDGSIQQAAAANPAGLVAEAAERFLGAPGYWLVIVAGVLSMLSALQANLLGASRVAFAMARDRTLPQPMGRMRAKSGTPAVAVVATAGMIGVVVLAVGDVAAAGAASSLIFLVSFATVHWAAILARRRSGDRRVPWAPSAGALLCVGLAVFQAFAVRDAGSVVAVWLVVGAALYLTLLAPGASLADASAEAIDPDLARLRGRSPLVLVPIANPASAAGLVGVASTVRTPGVGRILLLSVVQPPSEGPDIEDHPVLSDAQVILGESLQRSFERGTAPETLFTIASDAWHEIPRVAELHRCEVVVLGSPLLGEPRIEARLEGLIARLGMDVVIVRAQHRWRVASVRRVLVPIGGRREHSRLRARLLASLSRVESCHVTFLRCIAPGTPDAVRLRAERELRALAGDEVASAHEVLVEAGDPRELILHHAGESDLVVMGIRRDRARSFSLGDLIISVARETDVPLVLVGARPTRMGAGRRGQ